MSLNSFHSEPKLTELKTIKVEGTDIFKLSYDSTGTTLSCACTDGTARVYHAASGRLLNTYNVSELKDGIRMPCTSVLFRPIVPTMGVKGVLIACSADGSIAHYRTADGLNMGKIEENEKYKSEEHEFYCLDVASDASMIAAAGKDLKSSGGIGSEGKNGVYVFDEQTKTLITRLVDGDGVDTCGHTSRIFSLRFLGEDNRNDIIASGGWDGTVQIWDLRTQRSSASFVTGCISGDSIDKSSDGKRILVGSHIGANEGTGGHILAEYDIRRLDKPLEVYSPEGLLTERGLKTEERKVFDWSQIRDSNKMDYADETLIYSAAYGSRLGKEVIGACGYSPNCVKVFTKEGELIGSLEAQHPLYAIAFAPDSPFLAVGGEGGLIHMLSMK